MTHIESICEIKEAVIDLKKLYISKDAVVFEKARVKYEQLVNVFFRSNKGFETTKHCQGCLNDRDFFMKLMDEAVECYYLCLVE